MIALYVIAENVTCSDSFGVEHVPKEIKKFIGNKNIGFIDFMLKGKSLRDYTNLYSPNDYEKNDKIILKYFQ